MKGEQCSVKGGTMFNEGGTMFDEGGNSPTVKTILNNPVRNNPYRVMFNGGGYNFNGGRNNFNGGGYSVQSIQTSLEPQVVLALELH